MRRSDFKWTDPDLGVLTSRLLFAVQEELFDTLARQGHPNLRPQHGAVLAYLDAEGSRATDLARRSGQHKQVVGKLIDELEALGYVERRLDPSDRRAKLIVPTALGLDQMTRSDAILATIDHQHAQAVGADAYAEFKRLFWKITQRQRAWRDTLGDQNTQDAGGSPAMTGCGLRPRTAPCPPGGQRSACGDAMSMPAARRPGVPDPG